jgi:hypothetical protein
MKLKRKRWAGSVACIEKRKICMVVVAVNGNRLEGLGVEGSII